MAHRTATRLRRLRTTVELDPDFITLEQPNTQDPYKALVLAIIDRAREDAAGRVVHRGASAPGHIEAEARAWLHDGIDGYLLELAGYDVDIRMSQRAAAGPEKEDLV